MDDKIIRVIARLDTGMTDKELKKIEQRLNEKGIKLNPVFDESAGRKEIKQFAKQLKMVLEQIDPLFQTFGIRDYAAAIKSEIAAVQPVITEPITRSPVYSPSVPESGALDRFNNFALSTQLYLQALKGMAAAVYDIDNAMTRLYRVTEETDATYEHFLQSSAASAKELGRSISSLVTQTSQWTQLGYSFPDAQALSRTSSIYANIAGIDDLTAVSDIAAAMEAFNLQADQSLSLLDQLAAVSSASSISPADLGNALKTSASSMALTNNDIQETLAMIAGGSQITRQAGDMGNTLKISSLRLRGMKSELKDLGEDVADVMSVDQIQAGISAHTKGMVNLFDDLEPEQFKSTYEIFQGIADIWDHISKTDQDALISILGTESSAGSVRALLEAFQSGGIQDAYNSISYSDGAALQEQEHWMDSLEAKTMQLKSSVQSLSQTILNPSLLKFFIDLGTTGASALDVLIGRIGGLNTLGLAVGGILGLKNVGRDRMFSLNYHCFKLPTFMCVLLDTGVFI